MTQYDYVVSRGGNYETSNDPAYDALKDFFTPKLEEFEKDDAARNALRGMIDIDMDIHAFRCMSPTYGYWAGGSYGAGKFYEIDGTCSEEEFNTIYGIDWLDDATRLHDADYQSIRLNENLGKEEKDALMKISDKELLQRIFTAIEDGRIEEIDSIHGRVYCAGLILFFEVQSLSDEIPDQVFSKIFDNLPDQLYHEIDQSKIRNDIPNYSTDEYPSLKGRFAYITNEDVAQTLQVNIGNSVVDMI